MAIRRSLALAHRFRAPASEDLVFTLDLILDGVRCRHVDDARLCSEGESGWRTFGGQKVRYEAGRMAAARVYLPLLVKRAVRHRDAASLEAAWFLATPPFALAALSLLVALAVTVIVGAWPAAVVFGAGLAMLALVILIGLTQARAGVRTWVALLLAPWYLVWKAVVQLRALASVLRRDDYYPRPPASEPPAYRETRVARRNGSFPRGSNVGRYCSLAASLSRAPQLSQVQW